MRSKMLGKAKGRYRASTGRTSRGGRRKRSSGFFMGRKAGQRGIILVVIHQMAVRNRHGVLGRKALCDVERFDLVKRVARDCIAFQQRDAANHAAYRC